MQREFQRDGTGAAGGGRTLATAFAVFPTNGTERSPLLDAISSKPSRNGSLAPSVMFVSSMKEANAFFEHRDDGSVIVLYVQPELTLASSLAHGTSLDVALKEIREDVGGLLRLVQKVRERVVLVEQSAAYADPERLARALERRLGHAFPGVAALSLPEPAEPMATPAMQALGALALLEHPELRRRCAELEASTLCPPYPSQQQDRFEAALKELLGLQTQARRASNFQRVTEENERLLERLFKLENDLEAALRQGREIAKKEVETAKKCAAATQREREAKARLAAVLSSTSWRLTAPLRSVMGRLRRGTNGHTP